MTCAVPRRLKSPEGKLTCFLSLLSTRLPPPYREKHQEVCKKESTNEFSNTNLLENLKPSFRTVCPYYLSLCLLPLACIEVLSFFTMLVVPHSPFPSHLCRFSPRDLKNADKIPLLQKQKQKSSHLNIAPVKSTLFFGKKSLRQYTFLQPAHLSPVLLCLGAI